MYGFRYPISEKWGLSGPKQCGLLADLRMETISHGLSNLFRSSRSNISYGLEENTASTQVVQLTMCREDKILKPLGLHSLPLLLSYSNQIQFIGPRERSLTIQTSNPPSQRPSSSFTPCHS